MAWQPEMTRILRHLIDDLEATSYTNARLEEVILVSGQLMLSQVTFDNNYSIDVERSILTPDPTETSVKDNDFINLSVIKATTIILWSELKTLSAQAYRITDGPSSIDVAGVYKAKLDAYNTIKKDLDCAILQYQIGNGSGGQAILTPYTTSLATGGYTYVNRRN